MMKDNSGLPPGLCVGVLLPLLVFSRFANALALPQFNDEAIYNRWSALMHDFPSWRTAFIPAMDGKQPLAAWLTAAAMTVYDHPLVVERFLAGLFGVVSVLMLFWFVHRFFGRAAGMLFFLFAVFNPYLLFYTRHFLMESLLLFIWSLAFILLWKLYNDDEPQRETGLLLAVALFAGFFTKSLILLGVAASAVFPLVFWGAAHFTRRVAWHAGAAAFMLIAPIFLGRMPEKVGLYTMEGSSQILHNAFHFGGNGGLAGWLATVAGNLRDVVVYMGTYIGWLPLLIGLVALAVMSRERSRFALVCFGFFIIPALIAAIVKTRPPFSSRYFLEAVPFILMPLSVWLARYFQGARRRGLLLAVLAVMLVQPVWLGGMVVFNVTEAGLHAKDKQDHITGPTSGLATRQAAAYLRQRAGGKTVLLLTNTAWGNPADGIAVLLRHDPVAVTSAWWVRMQLPVVPGAGFRFQGMASDWAGWIGTPLLGLQKADEVYFISQNRVVYVGNERFAELNPNLTLVKTFPEAAMEPHVKLWRWDGRTVLPTTAPLHLLDLDHTDRLRKRLASGAM